MRKNYILDTNILLHDPECIFNFMENTVIIPIGVIEEIDRFKKEVTDRGYNARSVARLLDSLRTADNLTQGVPLSNGGTLKVHCGQDQALTGSGVNGDMEVLQVARGLRDSEPQVPCIIVTKDINLRIRADILGFRAEDYESDRVVPADWDTGDIEMELDAEQLEQFRQNGELPCSEPPCGPNQYVLLRDVANRRNTALARMTLEHDRLVSLNVPEEGICGIKPRNKEQYYAIDALLNDEVELVTLSGKAGTGKTVLALAAAMFSTLYQKRYRGVLVARPIVPMGRDMGYLPGLVEDKMGPWMKPISDNVDFLLDSGGPVQGHSESSSLLKSGLIEIQPLTYIRGRSISYRFVVIDEAQNLTPLEVKTVITRIGQDAKVVLTGDPYQIDNPYIDANSNGFIYLANRFRSQPMVSHVSLRKGERSALSELASNLL